MCVSDELLTPILAAIDGTTAEVDCKHFSTEVNLGIWMLESPILLIQLVMWCCHMVLHWLWAWAMDVDGDHGQW